MAGEDLEFNSAVRAAEGLRLSSAHEGRVERWELHNPTRRNAVTPAALTWIGQRCAQLDGQVVVLGSSEGPFCSGFDLKALQAALAENNDILPDQAVAMVGLPSAIASGMPSPRPSARCSDT